MSETKQVTEIKPLTYREDGYPCFVKGMDDRNRWDKLEPEWKEFCAGYYEYLQEEYDTPDPTFGQICVSATFGV